MPCSDSIDYIVFAEFVEFAIFDDIVDRGCWLGCVGSTVLLNCKNGTFTWSPPLQLVDLGNKSWKRGLPRALRDHLVAVVVVLITIVVLLLCLSLDPLSVSRVVVNSIVS